MTSISARKRGGKKPRKKPAIPPHLCGRILRTLLQIAELPNRQNLRVSTLDAKSEKPVELPNRQNFHRPTLESKVAESDGLANG
jgi:hypothetical protein